MPTTHTLTAAAAAPALRSHRILRNSSRARRPRNSAQDASVLLAMSARRARKCPLAVGELGQGRAIPAPECFVEAAKCGAKAANAADTRPMALFLHMRSTQLPEGLFPNGEYEENEHMAATTSNEVGPVRRVRATLARICQESTRIRPIRARQILAMSANWGPTLGNTDLNPQNVRQRLATGAETWARRPKARVAREHGWGRFWGTDHAGSPGPGRIRLPMFAHVLCLFAGRRLLRHSSASTDPMP